MRAGYIYTCGRHKQKVQWLNWDLHCVEPGENYRDGARKSFLLIHVAFGHFLMIQIFAEYI